MLEGLTKYLHNDHFLFTQRDTLLAVCNAPSNKSGVYIVYGVKSNTVELLYIGRSGKVTKDGKIFIRKAGLGGIRDRIINGHQFGKVPRKISWLNQMKNENLEALDIYWYVTYNDECKDCPRVLESKLLQEYLDTYGRLPKWNKEL